MLLVYALIGASLLSTLSYLYGLIVESKHLRFPRQMRTKFPDMWMEGLLNCEYSPAKQAYGPARILLSSGTILRPKSERHEEK